MAIIREINGWTPDIDDSAFVAETAVITGEVTVAAQAGIWYGAVLRGDMGAIHIGERSNIQDGVVVHCTTDRSKTIVGKDVTVGHRAVLHGCILEDGCLIGMGAVVMDNAVVKPHTIVAAGAVVLENQILESGYLYAGTPAKQIKKLTDAQKDGLKDNASHYVDVIDWYHASPY
ncbi:MAG: gamma carbonic anhydrase family protein [Deltaproteobacteria bacterium]|nr:gamma carbonic anhydrase family protein [Deltaproteobacteria bacterium]